MRRQGVTSGTLVTNEDDPRLEFLELSKKRCSYLRDRPVTTGESESKVITPPTPQRFVRTILALAAVLAAVVVAWEGSQIVSDRSMKQATQGRTCQTNRGTQGSICHNSRREGQRIGWAESVRRTHPNPKSPL